MNAKERRTAKHTLKTNFELIDTYIKLATTDNLLNVQDNTYKEKTKKERTFISSELTRLKNIITQDFENFISEIDSIIDDLK